MSNVSKYINFKKKSLFPRWIFFNRERGGEGTIAGIVTVWIKFAGPITEIRNKSGHITTYYPFETSP